MGNRLAVAFIPVYGVTRATGGGRLFASLADETLEGRDCRTGEREIWPAGCGSRGKARRDEIIAFTAQTRMSGMSTACASQRRRGRRLEAIDLRVGQRRRN